MSAKDCRYVHEEASKDQPELTTTNKKVEEHTMNSDEDNGVQKVMDCPSGISVRQIQEEVS